MKRSGLYGRHGIRHRPIEEAIVEGKRWGSRRWRIPSVARSKRARARGQSERGTRRRDSARESVMPVARCRSGDRRSEAPADGKTEGVRVDLDGAQVRAIQLGIRIDVEPSCIDVREPVAAELHIQSELRGQAPGRV